MSQKCLFCFALIPKKFPKKIYSHVLSCAKHANFGLKWGFWDENAHISEEKITFNNYFKFSNSLLHT